MAQHKTLSSVFKRPVFVMIWTAAAVSNIGNWMESVAQAWSVVQQTHGDPVHSAFLAELLSVADFAPVLMFGLLAGVISDRVNRKAWLFFLQLMACLLGAALAIIGYLGMLTAWRVIALTFAEGIIWALNGPAWMSVTPGLVPRDELEFAIAANSLQFNLARLVGPAIAGGIISIFSVNMAFAINALTFIPVLIALMWLPSTPAPTKPHASIRQDMMIGLRFTWGHPGARRLALMLMAFCFLSAPLQGLLAIFARQVLGGGSGLYGGMLASIGLGSLTGAVALGWIPKHYPRHHLIPLSMCLFSVFALLYTASHSVGWCLAMLYLCGVFWLLSLNPSNTATQLLATEENRGRILSVLMIASQGTTPLGHLFAGGLVHVMSPEYVVRSMVGVLLLLSIGFLLYRAPEIDQSPRRGQPPQSFAARLREAITAESHRPIAPREVVLAPALPTPDGTAHGDELAADPGASRDMSRQDQELAPRAAGS